jgi:hypothetical protein
MTISDHRHTGDQVESALEAAYGALMALESIRSDTRRADGLGAPAHVESAIESLRDALAQLRLSRSQSANPLVLGFVQPGPPGTTAPG